MSVIPDLITQATAAGHWLAAGGVPNPAPIQPPGTGGISTLLGWLRWVGLAVCVAGLMAAGAMMSIQSHRGEGGQHVARIGMGLGGVIVIGAAASLVGFLAQ